MKQAIAIVCCVLLFSVSFFTGCAGPTTQIKDKGVAAAAGGGAKAAEPAEKPGEKAAVNERAGSVAGGETTAEPVEKPARKAVVNEKAGSAAGSTKITEAVEKPAEKTAVNEKAGSTESSVKAAGTVEKPVEKTYVDKKGKFEISSTPFGYVKRDQKPAEKEISAPASRQQESDVTLTPVVKAPAQAPGPAAPPAVKVESANSTPGPSEKLEEKKVPEKTGQLSFDFDDADLYSVIRTMADLLKINYIVDPTVSGKVTIHTAGLLKTEDIFPIFYQTLEVNGLTAVKEGNLYRILKLRDALRMPIASRMVSGEKDIPPEERIIIQIIPLKFISAQELTKVITPFISTDGTIVSDVGSNTLLVVDKGINILKVLKLVEVFDVSVFEKISYRFYTLQNINAEDAAKLLKEILSLSAGSKDYLKFLPINRLNTLLVVSSSPDAFGRVDTFIRQLDIPSEGAKPQIHIYSVKNGMATELGEILRSIFGQAAEIKKSAAKESVPTNPFAMGYTERKTTTTTTATTAGATAAPAIPATPAPAIPASPAASEKGPSVTLRGEIRITADPIRNALIIEAIPSDYQIVEKVLGRLDVLPRQVLIEVVIAEISLGKGTELGIEWTFKKDSWTDSGPVSASIGASGLQYAIGLSQKWQAALHALARDSKVNILSTPSVLASDNKLAHIDVTTEVPIPSSSYTIATTGPNVLETKVEYRSTGVILDVTPHINEHGLVTMDVIQEVSNVGELLKVAGQDYYSFNRRKISTALTVKHNQSIVIGGLISNTKNDAASGVPWLVKIPFLRWLFGTETTNVSKSELILMITPRVITSLDDVDAVSEEFKRKIENAISFFK